MKKLIFLSFAAILLIAAALLLTRRGADGGGEPFEVDLGRGYVLSRGPSGASLLKPASGGAAAEPAVEGDILKIAFGRFAVAGIAAMPTHGGGPAPRHFILDKRTGTVLEGLGPGEFRAAMRAMGYLKEAPLAAPAPGMRAALARDSRVEEGGRPSRPIVEGPDEAAELAAEVFGIIEREAESAGGERELGRLVNLLARPFWFYMDVSVEGRVTDASGKPVEGAEVRVVEICNPDGTPFAEGTAPASWSARTGADGRYRIDSVAPVDFFSFASACLARGSMPKGSVEVTASAGGKSSSRLVFATDRRVTDMARRTLGAYRRLYERMGERFPSPPAGFEIPAAFMEESAKADFVLE